MSEQVMVVERDVLAGLLVERGLVRENPDAFLEVINERHFFIDRPTAEASPQPPVWSPSLGMSAPTGSLLVQVSVEPSQ